MIFMIFRFLERIQYISEFKLINVIQIKIIKEYFYSYIKVYDFNVKQMNKIKENIVLSMYDEIVKMLKISSIGI